MYHLLATFTGDEDQLLVFNWRTLVGMLLVLLITTFSPAAGVGGGGVIVPVFNFLVGFGLRSATSLAQSVMASAAFVACCINFTKPHPNKPQHVLVDLDVVLIFSPMLLLGVSIGILANVVLPEWLITVLLTVVLAYMCHRTLQKGRASWKQETARAQSAQQPTEQAAAAQDNAVEPPHPAREPENKHSSRHRKKQRPQISYGQLLCVVLVWLGFGAVHVLQSLVKTCSLIYFLCCGVQALLAAGCWGGYVVWQRRLQQGKAAAADGDREAQQPLVPAAEQELAADESLAAQLNWAKLCKVAIGTFVIGVIAGTVGVAGGMMFGVLLLELGVNPQVSTATSNVLVFMGTSSATLALALDGRLIWRYALLFASLAVLGATLGVTLVRGMVQRSSHPSLLVFLLAAIIGLSSLLAAVFGGNDAVHDWQTGEGLGLQRLCP